MRKILIIDPVPLYRASHTLRHLRLLQNKYEIHAIGFSPFPEMKNISFYELKNKKKIISFLAQFALIFGLLKPHILFNTVTLQLKEIFSFIPDPEIVIVHHVLYLKFVRECFPSASIILDAHEFYPGESSADLKWNILYKKLNSYLCRRYLRYSDYRFTVSPQIANLYKERYGYSFDVVLNSPYFSQLNFIVPNGEKVKMIHHGISAKDRNLELMIELMKRLDGRFTLDLMLVGENSYKKYLISLASEDFRISFVEPVPTEKISEYINKYDIGLFILPPNNENQKYSLPNKFFEFIQARLAVAIFPSHEMKTIAEQYQFGIIADDFTVSSVADKLNSLTHEQLLRLKMNAHAAARELSFENQGDKLLHMIKDALNE